MKILVGFDGSDGGRDALEAARVLGSEADASVMVASVLFSGPLQIDLAGLDEEEAKEAEPLFEQAREKLAGLDVTTRAYGGGSPAAILTLLAEREEFDVIVVGSPHRGPVGRVLIGSVARNLLNGAPRAVLVAPKGYATEDHGFFRTIAVGYDGTPEAEHALPKRRSDRAPLQRDAQDPHRRRAADLHPGSGRIHPGADSGRPRQDAE